MSSIADVMHECYFQKSEITVFLNILFALSLCQNSYPHLRVAYVEEVEERKKKEYYSVLVKGVNDSDIHQVYVCLLQMEQPSRSYLMHEVGLFLHLHQEVFL